MTTTQLSVVIPVFNGAAHLREAVASVHRGGLVGSEIIVVDDGSTDATQDVVRNLPEPVRFIRQEHAGPAAARNRGLAVAEGELVRFLDADDTFAPGSSIQLLERFRARPEIDMAIGYCQGYEERPSANGENQFGKVTGARLNFGIGTALFRRTALRRLGGFSPDLRYGEDLDLVLRAHEAGLVIDIIESITLYYRIHDSSSTHGRDIHELNLLKILKRSLERRRGRGAVDGG